jgi:hypothetical protein
MFGRRLSQVLHLRTHDGLASDQMVQHRFVDDRFQGQRLLPCQQFLALQPCRHPAGPESPRNPARFTILRSHIQRHGVATDGRLFRTERGGMLYKSGHVRTWKTARALALTASRFPTRQAALRSASRGRFPAPQRRGARHSGSVVGRP